MRLWACTVLRCVAHHAARCGGHLEVATNPDPTLLGEELREGALCCTSCGATYPVVAGVAVLVSNPFRYFRGFFPFAKGYLAEVGGMSRGFEVWLYSRMLADLESKKDKLFPRPQPFDDRLAHPMFKWLGTYLLTHYLAPVPSGDATLDALQEASHQRGPLRILGDMAQRWGAGAGLALDLGCSVGGLSLRLAGFCSRVIGIDLSFEKILTARRVLLREPCGPAPLRLYREGISFELVPLPEVFAPNLECVVATGEDIPMDDGSVDVLTSCNLIDIVNDPLAVLREKARVLAPGGVLAVSTPYLDHAAAVTQHLEAGRGDPRKTVLENLPGFEVVEEYLRVPWLLRASDRHWDLYLDHCFAARRVASQPAPEPTRAPTLGP